MDPIRLDPPEAARLAEGLLLQELTDALLRPCVEAPLSRTPGPGHEYIGAGRVDRGWMGGGWEVDGRVARE